MNSTITSETSTSFDSELPEGKPSPASRIISIDALRGLVMFTMIYVNDISGAKHVPWWMKHYSDNFKGSGMTFVDLVFPAFLFIVGMSIPIALGARIARGEPIWRLILHVLLRTLSLLAIGILMVNSESGPDIKQMGWSRTNWTTLLFLAAIFSFCTIRPQGNDRKRLFKVLSLVLRVLGWGVLIFLAFSYRDRKGERIISLHSSWPPVTIRTEWYGILGLIGWAYLVACLVYLIFRNNRVALLGCMALLLCLFAADRKGAFDDFWLANLVGIGETLGSQASITVAGMIMATLLLTPDTQDHWRRVRFAILFALGCAAAALLVHRLYGISKNSATPSWCLWACAITTVFWLIFYLIGDVWGKANRLKPFAIAGQNVLLAYLISDGVGSWLRMAHLGNWYARLAEPSLGHAMARSIGIALVVLTITALLNRVGFKLKL
jgi:heparan-alpha-glucosaminide N-acetyltransferase